LKNSYPFESSDEIGPDAINEKSPNFLDSAGMKNIVLEKIYDYLFQLSRAQALDALEQAITKTTDEEPQIRYSTGKGNILVRLSLKTSYLCLPAHCPS